MTPTTELAVQRWRDRFPIIFMGGLLGMAYGLMLDQITVRLSLEYFTLAHSTPGFIAEMGETAIAIFWGIRAGAPAGLILGWLLSLAATVGKWPKIQAKSLTVPFLILFIAVAGLTAWAGWMAWKGTATGSLKLPDAWRSLLPESAHRGFLIAWWMHGASYLGAILGSLLLGLSLIWRRSLLRRSMVS